MNYAITESKVTKIALGISVAALLVVGASASAAASPYDAISESNNPVFSQSGLGSVQNDNNPQLRFGSGGRIATPGAAGDHANENSAVAPWSSGGSTTIVDPQGF